MPYEFKKLSDVTAVEEVTNKTNVLIEEGGVIKKVNKSQVSGITEVSWSDIKNPPFGAKTEMVEILPEQSFTDNYDNEEESFYGGTYDYFLLNVESGTEYTFIINGNKYSNKFIADGDTRACEIYENGHPIVYMDNNGDLNVDWAKELGKTITLAIYEEQEVVTPIDIKYLPIEELKKALGLE